MTPTQLKLIDDIIGALEAYTSIADARERRLWTLLTGAEKDEKQELRKRWSGVVREACRRRVLHQDAVHFLSRLNAEEEDAA